MTVSVHAVPHQRICDTCWSNATCRWHLQPSQRISADGEYSVAVEVLRGEVELRERNSSTPYLLQLLPPFTSVVPQFFNLCLSGISGQNLEATIYRTMLVRRLGPLCSREPLGSGREGPTSPNLLAASCTHMHSPKPAHVQEAHKGEPGRLAGTSILGTLLGTTVLRRSMSLNVSCAFPSISEYGFELPNQSTHSMGITVDMEIKVKLIP